MWLHSVSWIQVYKDGIETTTGGSKVQKERGKGSVWDKALWSTWLTIVFRGDNKPRHARIKKNQTKTANKQTNKAKQSSLAPAGRSTGPTLTLAPRDPVRLLAHSTLHLSSTLAVAVVTATVGNWHIWISDVRPSFFPSPFMISLLNTQL